MPRRGALVLPNQYPNCRRALPAARPGPGRLADRLDGFRSRLDRLDDLAARHCLAQTHPHCWSPYRPSPGGAADRASSPSQRHRSASTVATRPRWTTTLLAVPCTVQNRQRHPGLRARSRQDERARSCVFCRRHEPLGAYAHAGRDRHVSPTADGGARGWRLSLCRSRRGPRRLRDVRGARHEGAQLVERLADDLLKR
jgi:hypothetical protein